MTSTSVPPKSQAVSKKAFIRESLAIVLRTVGLLGLVVLILSRSPDERNFQAVGVIIGMIILASIYIFFFLRQIHAVQKSSFPNIRAAEAMFSLAVLLIAIFASLYSAISLSDPEAFTEILTPFSSMYFSLTVLATVGFGDIAPHSVPARSVAMVQMVLDLVFIGLLVRVFANVAKRSLANRNNSQKTSD